MSKGEELTSLEQLLDRIDQTAREHERVSIGEVLKVSGRRSFGPLLLVIGLATIIPFIGGIPSVPTIMAVVVLVTAGQLLFGREEFWLPRWLLRRSLPSDKLGRALGWLRRPARFTDRLVHPRLKTLVNGRARRVIAALCIAIALVTPVTEFVPFSANIAGAALSAFGLALLSDDGLLALVAFLFTAAAAALILYFVL